MRSPPPLPDPNIPIVAVDLDSTLAESVWPQRREIGPPIPAGIELIHYYAELGYRVIVHTARPAIDESYIWAWVQYHGLPVDEVVCGKPFAGLFVDDRAYCPEYTKGIRKPVLEKPSEDVWAKLDPSDIEEAVK